MCAVGEAGGDARWEREELRHTKLLLMGRMMVVRRCENRELE